jgi:hypothetical protein
MIHLRKEDAQFMLSVLDLPVDLREILERVQQARAAISEEVADRLRDHCGERLQTHGFDDRYNPTEEGMRLEQLIDVLFIG